MNIGIIGQGAWGTALGEALKRNGYEPSFFDRVIDESALARCDGFVLAIPAQVTREVLVKTKHILAKKPLLITAKGIEKSTGFFQSQVVEDVIPGAIWSILSGPTFACEVVQNLPCAAVLSSMQEDTSRVLVALFCH
jgi:glycerol-3-phosphate dehydrogenase (NAD(P)+)